jgi:uncharacterized protein YwgA
MQEKLKSSPEIIVAIISLNGDVLVGKTRLQKTVYLIQSKGHDFGFEFQYHNFGPFSPDVAAMADLAEDLDLIVTEEKYGFHEVPYTVFKIKNTVAGVFDKREERKISDTLKIMSKYSSLDAELAATYVYLIRDEKLPKREVENELKRRKPVKATDDRLKKAKEMLSQLELG